MPHPFLGKASCSVCLETYKNDEVYIELPCMHKFHDKCILSWLKQTNSCPVCRFELPTDNEDYEELRLERVGENFIKIYRTVFSSLFLCCSVYHVLNYL